MNGQTSRQTQSQTFPLTESTLKHLQATTEPMTLVSDSYRTRTEQPIPTTQNGLGIIEKLKALVGSASDHSGRMSNLNLDPALPAWQQLPRIATAFIARNWYYLRWGLIVLLALFVVCVLLPAGLALLA